MNEVFAILRSFERLGEKKLENGATLIGKAPHIAPMAWLHSIYKPLSVEEVNALEAKLKISIPDSFKSFLLLSNGLSVFNTTFAIYGQRKNYSRSVENVWQPFDILLPNVDERPEHSLNSYLFVGGYDWDGSLLYINNDDGKVYRCKRESAKAINAWGSFNDMLYSEVSRLTKLFDEDGKEKDKTKPTIPT